MKILPIEEYGFIKYGGDNLWVKFKYEDGVKVVKYFATYLKNNNLIIRDEDGNSVVVDQTDINDFLIREGRNDKLNQLLN